ncbi:MAG: hypothetical protein H6622_13170 [Halobacteriovoraceae bacterium]|nr:hypothetical protein [Halobacteriovoraceae bacterium]
MKIIFLQFLLVLSYVSKLSANETEIVVRESHSIYLTQEVKDELDEFYQDHDMNEIRSTQEEILKEIIEKGDSIKLLFDYEDSKFFNFNFFGSKFSDYMMYIYGLRSQNKIDDLILEKILKAKSIFDKRDDLSAYPLSVFKKEHFPYPFGSSVDEIQEIAKQWMNLYEKWEDGELPEHINFLRLLTGWIGREGQRVPGLFDRLASSSFRVGVGFKTTEIIKYTNDPTLRERYNYKIFASLLFLFHKKMISKDLWELLEACRIKQFDQNSTEIYDIINAQKFFTLHNPEYKTGKSNYLAKQFKDKIQTVRQELYDKFNENQINLIKGTLLKLKDIITSSKVEIKVTDENGDIIHSEYLRKSQIRDYAFAKTLRGIEDLNLMPSFSEKGDTVKYLDLLAVGAELGYFSDRLIEALEKAEIIWEPQETTRQKLIKFYQEYAVVTTVLLPAEWQWLVLFGVLAIQATDEKNGHDKGKKIGIYF